MFLHHKNIRFYDFSIKSSKKTVAFKGTNKNDVLQFINFIFDKPYYSLSQTRFFQKSLGKHYDFEDFSRIRFFQKSCAQSFWVICTGFQLGLIVPESFFDQKPFLIVGRKIEPGMKKWKSSRFGSPYINFQHKLIQSTRMFCASPAVAAPMTNSAINGAKRATFILSIFSWNFG